MSIIIVVRWTTLDYVFHYKVKDDYINILILRHALDSQLQREISCLLDPPWNTFSFDYKREKWIDAEINYFYKYTYTRL